MTYTQYNDSRCLCNILFNTLLCVLINLLTYLRLTKVTCLVRSGCRARWHDYRIAAAAVAVAIHSVWLRRVSVIGRRRLMSQSAALFQHLAARVTGNCIYSNLLFISFFSYGHKTYNNSSTRTASKRRHGINKAPSALTVNVPNRTSELNTLD